MANGLFPVINYLIPQVGGPRCFVRNANFSATPDHIDFRTVEGAAIDAQPFRPSGAFMDNTDGADELVLRLVEINFTVRCPAGQSLNAQFPAPIDVTFAITGNGNATVVFVDFPVMPFRSF